jgi:hypothetical protein
MKDDQRWTALRGEARYAALLRRMRLDDLAKGAVAP